jgi:hypothetical protein
LECHGVCTYLPPERSQLDGFAAAPAFDLLPLAIVHDCAAAHCATIWEWLADPGDTASPQRLHLLHQVFLI